MFREYEHAEWEENDGTDNRSGKIGHGQTSFDSVRQVSARELVVAGQQQPSAI